MGSPHRTVATSFACITMLFGSENGQDLGVGLRRLSRVAILFASTYNVFPRTCLETITYNIKYVAIKLPHPVFKTFINQVHQNHKTVKMEPMQKACMGQIRLHNYSLEYDCATDKS